MSDLVERVADIISMVFEGQGVTETAEGVIDLIRGVALEEAVKVIAEMPRTYEHVKEGVDFLNMKVTVTATLNNGPKECATAIRILIPKKGE